jgi:hypothetical protein
MPDLGNNSPAAGPVVTAPRNAPVSFVVAASGYTFRRTRDSWLLETGA